MFKKPRKVDLIFTAEDVKGLDQRAIEAAFIRTFSGDDGRKVLAHLQTMTFHRALGPNASDEQLRYLEGQRALVGQILRLINGGRKA
jgi:hypothetical protein